MLVQLLQFGDRLLEFHFPRGSLLLDLSFEFGVLRDYAIALFLDVDNGLVTGSQLGEFRLPFLHSDVEMPSQLFGDDVSSATIYHLS